MDRSSVSSSHGRFIGDRKSCSSTKAQRHLDIETEKRINDTLRQLHITRVAVAHRPETIKAADRVFSIGRTAAFAKHIGA